MRRQGQSTASATHKDLRSPGAAESVLLRKLRDCPQEHSLRYTDQARASLLEHLFLSLACNRPDYLHFVFPNGAPVKGSPDEWNLSKAQGAVDGAEYSASARGKPCGHIFKSGEATYRCK